MESIRFDYRYEYGTYMMRRCSHYWKYCNGKCSNCYEKPVNDFPLRGYTFKYTDIKDTQGYPKYLFRRNEI